MAPETGKFSHRPLAVKCVMAPHRVVAAPPFPAKRVQVTLSLLALSLALAADPRPPAADAVGAALENVPYPYEVKFLALSVEGADLRMAYMDVAPANGGAGEPVVLLHGKN